MRILHKTLLATCLGVLLVNSAFAADTVTNDNFYQSQTVSRQDIKFQNILGMEQVGTLVLPQYFDKNKQYPALVIGHPFAAVRQQASLLYAQKLAEQGFVTLAFDHPFWGDSSGTPRGTVIPDLYTESYSAAVDYLRAQDFVNPDAVGAIGICASGGFALAATKIDPRIKALATLSMYDMGEYYRTGIERNRDTAKVQNDLEIAALTRDKTLADGAPIYGPGQNDAVFVEAKESTDFYNTPRGNVAANNRRTTPASYAKFANFYPLNDIDLIAPRPILFVAGEDAPTKQYTLTAYNNAGDEKELVMIKGANRIDLYDRVDLIPWEKLTSFFKQNLTVKK